MPFLRRWWPVLFLAAMPLLPLWRCAFLGEAIGPFEQIRQMAPWNGPKPERPWDVLQADGVLQTYVWRELVFDAWSRGQLPLWNPYQLAGTPLLANSQSAGFYPPHIAMGLLRVPTAPAITFLAWLHLFWAGLGVFALARRLGASEVGAAVGGASFALSPFLVSWTALASVLTTVAWIPWVMVGAVEVSHRNPLLAALRRVAQNPPRLPSTLDEARSFAETSFRLDRDSRRTYSFATTKLALAIAMMLLGGHLQFAAYGLLALLLLVLWLGFTTRRSPLGDQAAFVIEHTVGQGTKKLDRPYPRWMRLLTSPGLGSSFRCVLALVLGAMLAAPQLLPVLEHSKNAHRRGEATAEGYKAYVSLALKPYELGIIGSAQALGDPREPMKLGEAEVSRFWPALVKQGANFAESALTLGPLVLGLLFLVPWKRRELWPFAALGLLALLFALGTDLNRLLYFWVPGWSATGSPARIGELFVLCGCVLAAFGVDRVRELEIKSLAARLAAGGAVAAFFALLGPALAPPLSGIDSESRSILFSPAIASAILGIVAGPLLAFGTLIKPAGRIAVLGVPFVLSGIEGSTHLVMSGLPLAPVQAPPNHARVAVVNDPWSLHVAAPALMPPNTAALARISELGGYDSLMDRGAKELVDGVVGGDSAPPANGNIAFVKPGFDPVKLADAGVSEVWSRVPLPQLGEPDEEREGYAVWRPQGWGRAFADSGSATILVDGYDHQVVRVAGAGRLVVKDRLMDGWTAWEGGFERPMGPGTWREVEPALSGEHDVEFRYSPPGLRAGTAAAIVAGALLIGAVLPGLRRPANRKDAESNAEKTVVQ